MNDIANKPGLYRSFSGTITYRFPYCVVKDATFEILEEHMFFKGKVYVDMIFHSGTITEGNLSYVEIKKCNFYGNKLSDCVFHDGVFAGKEFTWSFWYGGVWKSGEWGNYNYDKFGCRRLRPPPFDRDDKAGDIISQPGKYKNFTGYVDCGDSNFHIKNGELEIDENSYSIAIDDGVITEGSLDDVVINYVVFNSGRTYGCDWLGGIFNNGTFNQGEWNDGIWNGGIWRGRHWKGGFDKFGNWHNEGDTPDKWNI